MESKGKQVFGYLVLEASRNCRSVSTGINVLPQELVKLSELASAPLAAAVQLPSACWGCPALGQCKGRNGLGSVLLSLSAAPFAPVFPFCLSRRLQHCLLELRHRRITKWLRLEGILGDCLGVAEAGCSGQGPVRF